MMRMKGHAIHDAAEYVPKPLFEFWNKRDPIARFENYLLNVKKWLSPTENRELIAGVERRTGSRSRICRGQPMPEPESAAGGVYCENGCHEIKPKYAIPKITVRNLSASEANSEAAVHLK